MTNMPADFQDEDEVEDFKPLTAQEASAWRSRFPQVSVWRIVMVQTLVGVIVALLSWLITGRAAAGWSAAYGALAVVLPAALFFCRLVYESDTSGITSLDTVSKAVTAVRAADKSSPTYGITVPIRHTIPSV